MGYRDLLLTPEPTLTSLGPGVKPIAKVFGVPFDATTTFRPGARFGPTTIRQAYLNIEVYSPRLGLDPEGIGVEDLGDLRLTGDGEYMAQSVERLMGEVASDDDTCGVLGGEHTLTFGAYSALHKDTALVIFDGHLDLRDEFAGLKLSHATHLRRLIEKVGAEAMVHVGSRAASPEEWKFADSVGLSIISTQTICAVGGAEKLLRTFLDDFERVYVSIDLDVLDPAFAPGVGNPEPAGLSTHQLLDFLYTIKGKRLVAFDIVEFTPLYDNGTTAAVAAKLLAENFCLASLAHKLDEAGPSG